MILHDIFESHQQCPECGGPAFSDLILAEKKDACYYKVKASAKVWPSAYASGRLVQCRKKGAANYGNKSEGVEEAVSTGPYIVYATGPRTMGVNDVDLVFKDISTGKIVAHVVGNNQHLQEFAPSGGGGGGGDGLPERGPTYEIRMNNSKAPTYVAFGDPQQDSEHQVYKLGTTKPGAPEYYGHGLTLVSQLDWWSFLEKMLGEIMDEDDAIEAGYVDRQDNGDLVFVNQQEVTEDAQLAEEFDLIESIIDCLAEHNGVDAEAIWEDLESLTDDELYVFAVTTPLMEDWQKVNKRDRTDGMSRKAVNAYRRENPGSKLKTAVTTKPSKLKRGSKASKRRSSYCSRSRGQMKMHSISCAKTPDKAICKARRRWNCESVDLGQGMAEGRFDEPLTGWHIVYRKSGNPVHATPSFETKDQAQKYLMTRMFANHQDYKIVHTAEVGVAEGKLQEISLGDYEKKASMSKALSQMGAAFAPDAERRAKELATAEKRKKGLARAKTRTDRVRAAAEKKSREASMAKDREDLPHMKAKLRDLESRLDPNFEYSDDHSFWRQQKDLQDKIQHLKNRIRQTEQGVAEGKPREKEADYGPDYQDMVARVKKLAGLGPLKTVWDPQKRVYRNMPVAQQPKK